MTENKFLENWLPAWSFNFNKYVTYKVNLFNSMIAFNSLLIASLSIVSVINNNINQILLFTFLISAFIPIALIIKLLYHLADVSLKESNKIYSLVKIQSTTNLKIENKPNNRTNSRDNKHTKNTFVVKFCEKSYIPWSIFNFIFFLLILNIDFIQCFIKNLKK